MLPDFQIAETDSFQEDIYDCVGDHQLAQAIYSKIVKNLFPQLKQWPYYGRNIKKLKGYRPETWRHRMGNYRIFYQIDPQRKIITLYAFSDRKDAYRQ